MRISCSKDSRTRRSALSATAVAILALGASSALANDIRQSGEQKDMRRVGHVNLQGRAAYHPYFINYPDGRVIAFVGTHSSAIPPTPPTGIDSNLPKPNPLKPGSPVEANGTMIVDITNPARPVEKFHIPGPIPQGGAQTQSNRMCLGSDLPGGISGRVYMMRNVQTNNADVSGYEVWDVTDVTNPTLVGELRNLRNTHKHWWECKTGIAYLPGSKKSPQLQDSDGVRASRCSSSIGAIPRHRSTSALTGCRAGNRVGQDLCRRRCMVQFLRTSIPKRLARWRAPPRRTT